MLSVGAIGGSCLRTLTFAVLFAWAWLGPDAQAEPTEAPTIDFIGLEENGPANAFNMAGAGVLRLPFSSVVPVGVSNEIEIYVTPFRDEQRGRYLIIEPEIIELPELQAVEQRIAVTLDRTYLTLGLRVPDLPTADDYQGQLVVQHNGQLLLTAAIDLRRTREAQPVKLTVERSTIELAASAWPWGHDQELQSTTTIRNENEEWRARGVHLRLLDVTHPDDVNFDPVESLALYWNDVEVDDLWRPPPPDQPEGHIARSIGANDQITLRVRARELPPGEYSVKFAVGSLNVGAAEPPELTLTLRTRHNIVWPTIVLVIAILISLITTKGFQAQSERVKLLKRVAEIRPAWLREEPPTLAVVAVRSILSQAERRCRSLTTALFAPEIMSARVEKAAQLLGPIGRVRQIRRRIEAWDQPVMIRNRAEKRLRGIVADLDPETASEEQTAEIDARLDNLAQWLTSESLYELYWADLKGDVDRLRAVFSPTDFAKRSHQTIAKAIVAILNKKESEVAEAVNEASSAEPKSLRDFTEIEEYYCKVKLLWERHSDDDQVGLDELFGLLKQHGVDVPVATLFKTADERSWRRLIDACKESGSDGQTLQFVAPRESTIQPLQAFQLIHFEIGPKDAPKLTNNYLFKHGVEYSWSLELEPSQWPRGYRAKELLTRSTSDEPRIIQYVPHKGRLHIAVDLCREGRCEATLQMAKPRPIAASGDFGWTSAFRFSGVAASIVAALFAIVSGLGTFYFDAAVFGTPQDYIALFIWGAGIDQTKNFIQNLEHVSPPN